MNFLALDTSTNYCSVAIRVNNKNFSLTKYIPRQHNKFLLKMIDEVIKMSGIDKKDLDFIAYGVGPGSFVGVRLSASVCQAFAVGLNIPVIGFSSMYAIALSTEIESKQNKAVILDAKMGDYYLGLYNYNSRLKISSEKVYKLEEFDKSQLENYLTIGDNISQINFNPEISDFYINVENILDFILNTYNQKKSNNELSNESFPIYLRGTSHWS